MQTLVIITANQFKYYKNNVRKHIIIPILPMKKKLPVHSC